MYHKILHGIVIPSGLILWLILFLGVSRAVPGCVERLANHAEVEATGINRGTEVSTRDILPTSQPVESHPQATGVFRSQGDRSPNTQQTDQSIQVNDPWPARFLGIGQLLREISVTILLGGVGYLMFRRVRLKLFPPAS